MESNNNEINFAKLIIRYLSFWPYFLASILISLLLCFIYLRYVEYEYYSDTVIEVIDKAQDSEMALPTSMTIFNRSMVNLNNEIGRLKSFDLNRHVTSKLKSNNFNYIVIPTFGGGKPEGPTHRRNNAVRDHNRYVCCYI